MSPIGSDVGVKRVMEISWQPEFYLSAIEIAAFEVAERKVVGNSKIEAHFDSFDKFVGALEFEVVELVQLAVGDSIVAAAVAEEFYVAEEFDIGMERRVEFSDSMQNLRQFVELIDRDLSHIARLMDCRRADFDKLDLMLRLDDF